MAQIPEGYFLSDLREDMQVSAIQTYLAQSYWAKGVPPDIVARSIEGSFCVGVFFDGAQVGFARIVTDYATFAYLADVYVLPEHEKRGLAKAMVRHLQDHEKFSGLRHWLLMTADAHTLYASLGWSRPDPSKAMQRSFPDIYQ